jgi:hypothetical protein
MAANNYYLGQTPEEFFNKNERYFYGIRRDEEGFLTLTKVNMDTSTDAIEVQDLNNIGTIERTYDGFDDGVDFFDGVDAARVPAFVGLKYEQYKWSADDLYYFVDGEGRLSVRINVPYNYVEGISQRILAENYFVGSTLNLGAVSKLNPLDNNDIIDLGLINDGEATLYALDMGTIV